MLYKVEDSLVHSQMFYVYITFKIFYNFHYNHTLIEYVIIKSYHNWFCFPLLQSKQHHGVTWNVLLRIIRMLSEKDNLIIRQHQMFYHQMTNEGLIWRSCYFGRCQNKRYYTFRWMYIWWINNIKTELQLKL